MHQAIQFINPGMEKIRKIYFLHCQSESAGLMMKGVIHSLEGNGSNTFIEVDRGSAESIQFAEASQVLCDSLKWKWLSRKSNHHLDKQSVRREIVLGLRQTIQ